MDGLIIGFIVGYFVRVVVGILFDEYQTNKELREAKIEVDLDRCCENAYNYGYEKGRLEEQMRSDRKLKELYERYVKPIGEKGTK
jgi:hypothetical protein